MSTDGTVLVLAGSAARSHFALDRLRQRLRDAGAAVSGVYAEYVHLLELNRPLSLASADHVAALLRYGPEQDLPVRAGQLVGTVLPRLGSISPWSSKATDIFSICGIDEVVRVERGVRWFVDGDLPEAARGLLFDRMTERLVPGVNAGQPPQAGKSHESEVYADVFLHLPPAPVQIVAASTQGAAALAAANTHLGLALSDEELDYLLLSYRELGRDPTDVELMMFAQANSEHCRHKIFNADWLIDGKPQPHSLFSMIRNTHRHINGEGVLSAYSDNAAVIQGPVGGRFTVDHESDVYGYRSEPIHILMKVETHNHPTAISPYPGAATGSGGEIRDEGAVGRGSKPKAGLSGFTTSHLNLPGWRQPWELDTGKPDHIVSALDIMIEGPVGAAGFNNEFGRPALAGYFRTFEWHAPDDPVGRVRGYHKPVMIAGGVGNVVDEHVHALSFTPGTRLVVLGGPAMLIGLGGGAASSMASGASSSDLDFASVQRDNAEMERRCQEVIDRCVALGKDNPILLIHDVGAGGLSNALPELVKDGGTGGRFDLRAVPSADPGMSPLEIWCNEAQERYVLGIAPEAMAQFAALCARERCPFALVGTATADAHLRVEDPLLDNVPVDLPLGVLFGKTPKMQRSFARTVPVHPPFVAEGIDIAGAITRVLRFPAVASKQFLITIGDRSITGLVAQEQMVGPWQVPVSDVAVTLSTFDGVTGEAFAMGERSPLAVVNPVASARMAVAESLTNLVMADIESLGRVVLSANWMAAAGEDAEEQALFDAVQAVGMSFCPDLGIAIPVGKDSLSMQSRWRTSSQGSGSGGTTAAGGAAATEDAGEDRQVISPLTLIVTAFAPVTDARTTLTPELVRNTGDTVLILLHLGSCRLGGSALAQTYGQMGGEVPDVEDAAALKALLEYVRYEAHEGTWLAAHDRSDGGLLAAALEMSFAGRVGLDVDLASLVGQANLQNGDQTGDLAALFAEEVGVVVQVRRADVARVLANSPVPAAVVGAPRLGDEVVRVLSGDTELFRSTRGELQQTWAELSYRMQALRDHPECAQQEFDAIVEPSAGLTSKVSFATDRDVAAPFIGGARPRIAVLREQGVNGQIEMAAAFDRAGFQAVDVHMSDLLEGRRHLADFPAVVTCGGFSYGDVLGGGGGWAKSVLFHDDVSRQFADMFAGDTLVLGVCNGCQMLAQLAELIPGAQDWPRFVRNRSQQFEARTTLLRIEQTDTPWLDGMAGSVMPVALAHGEGCPEYSGPQAAARLAASGGVVMRYVDDKHAPTERYPANPNGAAGGLAGITAANGRVLAMMPHPERVFLSVQNCWQDPAWQTDGPWMRLFRNARVALR